MAYDADLAQRLRAAMPAGGRVSEVRMFGGLCFMLNGNMLCGVHKSELIFRVGKEQHTAALVRPGARPMDITGRPMAGFVFVDPARCDRRRLESWVALAGAYVGRLPVKQRKARPTRFIRKNRRTS